MYDFSNNCKDNNEEDKYRIITEQGDLGLGAEILGESDQEVIKKKEKEWK